ncbi:MAG: YjbQ family protein [Candidatus Aenigmatarchaeota archaeon]|nr:MAG: YjbQ family protein [Candidatus Aenigmarchaeota archaeon]
MVEFYRVRVRTKGNTDVIDITQHVADAVEKSNKKDGIAVVFVPGSTAAITTIEYEPNLVKDIKNIMEKLVPSNIEYLHHKTWGDDNGSSHIRASIVKPSLTVPFQNKELLLGTWQQIVLMDFDTREREREIIIQIIGE